MSYVNNPLVTFNGNMAGPGYSTGNAAHIEVRKQFNGSGPTGFGGAKDWPVVRLEAALPSDAPVADIEHLVEELTAVLERFGYTR